MREPPPPPPPDPAEGLSREWPELEAFGAEWVKRWLGLRERVEIAKVLGRFTWMAEVIRQRPVGVLHPYMIEVYVARGGSAACLSLTLPKAFRAQSGSVKETGLELEFSWHKVYENKI
jgi:hypothetical protein